MSASRVVYNRFSPLARLMMSIVGVVLLVIFAGYLRACLASPPAARSGYGHSAGADRQIQQRNQLNPSEPTLAQQVLAESATAAARIKWASLCVLGVPSLVLALFNLYCVGPNYIAFDFARRQVLCVSGFPLVGKRTKGDFTDIEGLRLTGGKYQNPSVVVVWKQPQRPVTLLQSFPNERIAREMMRALSRELDVSAEA